MGNTSTKVRSKNKNVVRVSNLDGKMLEFHSPLVIKDLLSSYPNCYLGAFKEATQPLPPDYKLRVGKVYYLLPLIEKVDDGNTKKIKVVVTKKELKKLMTTQMGRVMDGIPEGDESG